MRRGNPWSFEGNRLITIDTQATVRFREISGNNLSKRVHFTKPHRYLIICWNVDKSVDFLSRPAQVWCPPVLWCWNIIHAHTDSETSSECLKTNALWFFEADQSAQRARSLRKRFTLRNHGCTFAIEFPSPRTRVKLHSIAKLSCYGEHYPQKEEISDGVTNGSPPERWTASSARSPAIPRPSKSE
jgi:hypothetical protein